MATLAFASSRLEPACGVGMKLASFGPCGRHTLAPTLGTVPAFGTVARILAKLVTYDWNRDGNDFWGKTRVP